MAGMDEMYQTLIIEHDRSPRNFKRLDAQTHHAEGRNPLCGDEVSLDLVVDTEGRISEVGFQGQGCAVSRASSSMMTTAPRTGSRPLPSMSLPHWIARVIRPPDWPSCYQVAPLGFGEPAGALA